VRAALELLQVEAVDVPVEEQAGTHVVRELLPGPDGLGGDGLVRGFLRGTEAEELRTVAERGRDEQVRFGVQRPGRVLVVVAGKAQSPREFTRRRVVQNQTVLEEPDDEPPAAERDRVRGAVARRVAAGGPDRGAVGRVERHQTRLGPADRQNHPPALDQRRGRVPEADAAKPELLPQVHGPHFATVRGAEAARFAHRRGVEDPAIVPRRGRVGSGVRAGRLPRLPDPLPPQLGPGVGVQRQDELPRLRLVLREQSPVGEDEPRVTLPEVARPQHRWTAPRPVIDQPGLGRDGVVVRPAEVRPIGLPATDGGTERQ
jgi:hypothetical protein